MTEEWIDRLSLRGEQLTLCLARAYVPQLSLSVLRRQHRLRQDSAASEIGSRRARPESRSARVPGINATSVKAFDFAAVPMISKAQVHALAAGDAWIEKGANLLCFGPTESDS